MGHGENETIEGVGDFAQPFDLPPDTISRFRRDGHCVVRGLASTAEIDGVRPAIESTAAALAWDQRPMDERDTYGKAFDQSGNLWLHDARCASFVRSPRFAQVAATLLGVEGVRLYHDQALVKRPGGGRTPWHQDRFFWPLDAREVERFAGLDAVTMWMPLVDIGAEVGSMHFISGSHTAGDLAGGRIGDGSDRSLSRVIEERGWERTTHGAMTAGDATFHAGWTVHSAPENPTGLVRSVMTVIYFIDGTVVAEPASPHQDLDRLLWFPGLEPGDPAVTDTNPRLWPPVTS